MPADQPSGGALGPGHRWVSTDIPSGAVAYRMLGSLAEADDAVQDAWLRFSRSDPGGVENLGGWLTTIVARIRLNMLQSCRSRREEPLGEVGEQVPDPVGGTDPEARPCSPTRWAPGGKPRVVFDFTITAGKIIAIDLLSDPEPIRFVTRSTESDLWRHLRLTRTPAKPRNGFFLRAESFYNVATEIENLAGDGPGLFGAYGGRSLHVRSHGESFLAIAMHRFGPNGLYLLDEPEAALSVRGQLALLARMRDLVGLGCQFLVATHSPILTAFPGALIVQIDETGLHRVSYDEAGPVQLTRSFLENSQRFLRSCFRSLVGCGA